MRVLWFDAVGIADIEEVGGKNASLGEMLRSLSAADVRVPNGFATTADAFREFIDENRLAPTIETELRDVDYGDVEDLARRARRIRAAILAARLPQGLRDEVATAYRRLSDEAGMRAVHVAVRSSATAEDLPDASFAGQQESFLMVHGEAEVLDCIRRCFASLYTARATSYRHDMGISPTGIALSAGVQRMVRADLASSGVMFTLDTDSGCRDVVYVTSSWGLGENIVQGRVEPDGFYVHKDRLAAGFSPVVGRSLGTKELTMGYDGAGSRLTNDPTSAELRRQFSLTDREVLDLARWGVAIEAHYAPTHDAAMDIEWAKDGITGELFIVQARPETVHSRAGASAPTARIYHLRETGPALVTGRAVGQQVATGSARRILSPNTMDQLQPGEVLVTSTTDPDWEPVLKRAAALVTEHGGRTSHAAIVARELQIPAIVGTGEIGDRIQTGEPVTVSCAEGETGVVYGGELRYEIEELELAALGSTSTDIMINLADPGTAFAMAALPTAGVGLARMEFIFAGHVGVHPLALTRYDQLDAPLRRRIDELTAGYDDRREYLIDRLAQGIGTLAAAFWPRPVILRFSDFKSNEYANLLGGAPFEPVEPNPMIGWRGASRYYDDGYREGFKLEGEAVRRVRDLYGLTNLAVMVPFCRTPDEGRRVLDELAGCGLARGHNGLEVFVMAEVPSNVFRAAEFAEIFDGFSIGSNDLTQLVLGVDRDAESVAHVFDERDEAVKTACAMVVDAAHRAGVKVGICGQAPSDYPEFAEYLVSIGIDSISVTPDALGRTLQAVQSAETLTTAGQAQRSPAAV